MQNLNKISKIFLYLTVLAFILWLGAYLSRLLLTYQLFQAKDFILKSYVTSENLPGIFITINSVVVITFTVFPVFIISFILFLIFSKVNLKHEGWLFISLLIIFITAPFEIYLMRIDYSIITKVLSGTFDYNEVLELYIKRMKILSSFSLIELFSYFSIVFIVLFKPLKIIPENGTGKDNEA